MSAKRSTKIFFLLLAAVLFALHLQLMPRVDHGSDRQAEPASVVAQLHSEDCDGGCCRGTACCIQASLLAEAGLPRRLSDCFDVVPQVSMPLDILKPLHPPPRAMVA